jgi:iduronate 2-sulfatase
MSLSRFLSVALVFLILAGTLRGAETKRPNVLLIVADDLRVELGCYGSKALTPNIDALARRGVQFSRAYCQQALCNPSRSSFLTGKRPDTLGLWCNSLHFRELAPDVVTLPQYFQQQGYVTRDVGKIFHNWHTMEKGDRRSWSAPEFLYYENHGNDKPLVPGSAPPISLSAAPKTERCDVPDEAYFDGRVAAEAVRVLDEIKDQPFFLAVGFWKPHAPFNAPAKYWDLYKRDQLPTLLPNRPKDAPDVAFHDGRELRGIPPDQVTFSPAEAEEIRHGYFANISYMDTQVGKVLAELDRLGLRESTLIVFMADHGYHLGEHGLWGKTSCFEYDARVPLVIVPPGCQHAGAKTDALVELVDLFPTFVDLCGLPVRGSLDGQSLAPVLASPRAIVKSAAFTQHPRPAYYDRTEKGVPDAMGYSVRTPHVRYTEWRDWETGKVVGRELYEHARDPHELENTAETPHDPAALAQAQQHLAAQFPLDSPPASRGRQ